MRRHLREGFSGWRRWAGIRLAVILASFASIPVGIALWSWLPWDGKPAGDAVREEFILGALFGSVPMVAFHFAVFSWFVVKIAPRRIKLQDAALQLSTDTSENLKSAVENLLKSAFDGGAYGVTQAYLFGSLVHEGRTPSDVDVAVVFGRGVNIPRIAESLSREISPLIEEYYHLEVHWEYFTVDEPADIINFLQECANRGGYRVLAKTEAGDE